MAVAQQFDDLFLDDSSAGVFSLPESIVTVNDFEHPQTFVPKRYRVPSAKSGLRILLGAFAVIPSARAGLCYENFYF